MIIGKESRWLFNSNRGYVSIPLAGSYSEGLKMFCKKCGADIGDAKFCPKCGEAIEADNARPPAPAYSGKTVNKIAYGLIAIFLGWLGIHRFYAGRWVSGILYIVSDILIIGLFITPLLGLIEGIIALTREDDGYGNIPVQDGKYFI